MWNGQLSHSSWDRGSNYEAQTSLGVGVLQCPTHVSVRHLYDTRTSHVGIVRHMSEKSNKCHQKNVFFFFASTLFELVSDTVWHSYVRQFSKVLKGFVLFYGPTFLIHFLVKSLTSKKVKRILKQCHHWRIKGINFD